MAHISQQSASGKFINSRAGRDADPRVALPLPYSPPTNRAVAASNGQASSMGERSVSVTQVRSAEEHPTIVQSSAELASKANMPGSNGVASNVHAAIKAGEMTNYSTDHGSDVQQQGSHYIKIDGVEATSYEVIMGALHHQFGWGHKAIHQKVTHSAVPGRITLYIVFDDIRDAVAAHAEVCSVTGRWIAQHVTYDMFSTVVSTETDSSAKYDGQVMFEIKFVGRKPDLIDIDGVRDFVFVLANTYGPLRVFKDVSHPTAQAWQFRVEYWKISNAKTALMNAGPNNVQTYKNWTICAKEIIDMSPVNGIANAATGQPVSNGGTVGIQCSLTGRTSWSTDEHGTQVPQQPARQLISSHGSSNGGSVQEATHQARDRFFSAPAPVMPAAFDHVAPPEVRSQSFGGPLPSQVNHYTGRGNSSMDSTNDQHVNVYAILDGRDVRTTVMLRNVPNKWTAENLKHALDLVVFGRYDFSYLRIDFSQNTNVGYAFVNFMEARDIVAFVNRWVGREWEHGGWPRKTCQISYATIQGIECLVEKFRNSAVMDEFPGFRPKLWYTVETAGQDKTKVGKERDFPAPNNMSKKQRSHDNAAQIGLYAPRTNQRGGDRPRRSQFDRGTSAQINEDAYYSLVSGRNPYAATATFHGQPRLGPGPYFNPMYYGETAMPAAYGYNALAMPNMLNGYVPHTYAAPASYGESLPRAGLPVTDYRALTQTHFPAGGQTMDLAPGGYSVPVQQVNGAYVNPNATVVRTGPEEHNAGHGQATATSADPRRGFGVDMPALY